MAAMCASCGVPVVRQTNGGGYYDVDNKGSGWGFKKEQGQAPYIPDNMKSVLSRHNAFYIGNADEKKLYLTFDEGYENGHTSEILDTLHEKGVPAAFFITGDYFNRSGDLVERMINDGHIVGNHTYYHHNLHKLSEPNKMAEELETLQDKFKEKFGYGMKYMRPPEGEYSERVLAVASDLGYKTIFWSFAYKDWEANNVRGADYAVGQIMPYLHNGEILLLHAVSADNAKALPQIIDKAREQGYEFASLDDLLQ